MAGKVDIQVAIGADASPLEREVAKARGSVHGLARDVERASKSMAISPPSSPRHPAAVRAPSVAAPATVAAAIPVPIAAPLPPPPPIVRTVAPVPMPAPMPMVIAPLPAPAAPIRPVVPLPAPAAPAAPIRPVVPLPAPAAPAAPAAPIRPIVPLPAPAAPPPVVRPIVPLPAPAAPPTVVRPIVPPPQRELPPIRTAPQAAPLPRVYLPPVTQYDPRQRAQREFMPGLPEYQREATRGPMRAALPPPMPTIPTEVLTGARRKIDAMAGASAHLGTSADKAAHAMERAAKVTRGPAVYAAGRASEGKGIAAQLVRRPEFNFMGRMEGLLGGLTLGGLMMWGKGAMEAAEKSRELARAARLPMEEFVRLQKAAKDNQVPIETLNAAIKDYAEGTITLQQVGEAVGIIGMKAGGASEDVKRLANEISDLAELNKQLEIVQEGASSFGKKVIVGLSRFFGQWSRMAIEKAYQGRDVGWQEAGEMVQESRNQEKQAEVDKAEKALKEKRVTIKVQADLAEFFGDLERRAAKGVKIKALQDQLDERVARITVKSPGAGDSLARIGGFMGGRMDNRGLMIAERQLRVAEETAEYTKQVAKAMAE